MKISILCSDVNHPISPSLSRWAELNRFVHEVEVVSCSNMLVGGDILFLISCNEPICKELRALFRVTLVIHASDLPLGRGWSPHIWQVLEKKQFIKVTLLEAADIIDSGSIWTQIDLIIEEHETFSEINAKLFEIEMALMDFAILNFEVVQPQPQDGRTPTHYRKRTPADSRIDPQLSIADQFDILRVADPERFPAFFELHGHRYLIHIQKDKPHADR